MQGRVLQENMESLNQLKNKIVCGDSLEVLKTLPSESIDCAITSPPYWALRDYGVAGQLGLEPTFQEYITKLCDMFDELKRVLKKEGTCWVNLGDTYSGNKEGKTDNKVSNYLKDTSTGIHKKATITEKCLCQIPSRFAIEMTNRGWILRNTIIWYKKNAMPSSVLDRLTNKYEQVFFFTKDKKYYFELDSIRIPFETDEHRPDGNTRAREKGYNTKLGTKTREQEIQANNFGIRRNPKSAYERNPIGKNPGDVWTLTSEPQKDRHFAMFPQKLITPMILAGSPTQGIVLDIFMGAGTTGLVAKKLGRNYLGIELNPEYIKIAEDRIAGQTPPML